MNEPSDQSKSRPGQISRRTLLGGLAASTVAAVALGQAGPAAATLPSADVPLDDVRWPKVRPPRHLADIVHWDAAELSVAIRTRVVTCVQVMTAYLNHIDKINPKVNAIVSLRPRADLLAQAAEKDSQLAAGNYQGWMHGFPHAVKDLANVAGFKTTLGFFRPPFDVPPATADALHVERIRAAGAIFIGKTNTPEFGLGSQTYNNVFGTTFNAYDQTKTSGGSSGGAAVAVALRMLPVADGSDFFGSLRNPPGWNNVFGLRPGFGRVPGNNSDAFVQQGGVEGPIARTALDLALLLRTMSGYDARAPLSIEQDPAPLTDLATKLRGKKVAWLDDLGGYLPMEPEVLDVCRAALPTFSRLGMNVTTVDSLPSFGSFSGTADLWPTWLIFRHWLIGGIIKPLYDNPTLRAAMKPEAIYEIDGLLTGADGNGPITGLDTYNGSVQRTALYQAFRLLFEDYDYAVLPTAQVFPFDASIPWPTSINGVAMSAYHRWMEVTAIGTLLNAPTLAMPAGFSRSGLPIGLQVIARNHDDFSLMDLAHVWERATRWVQRVKPALLRST
ncbi:MAG TPA: amidase [Jatrophihabitans sp.]|nr:amidase [Jatrophihabitans sp.]